MNIVTRTLAVAFAAAGLTLTIAPLAGAATAPTATAAIAPAHHWGHHGHHRWFHDGQWNDDCANYYYNGVWYQSCGDDD
ncbi:MAG TPA: hypothetical protein VHU88_05350 [Sporichthyaceae bacterium]|jgi:hypothetical protein|nr:hypothetical protein [Sporichthyaceae bacterium]